MKPSLFERAAEIYDFESGLRVGGPAVDLPLVDLPPPRPRAVPAPPRPLAEVREAASPPRPARPAVARTADAVARVVHQRVALDREALARQGFILPDAPASGLAEEVRLIKRRLIARVDAATGRGDDIARAVLIASGQAGDGKTYMTVNLALSIAGEQDRAVLLIDGDTAKPDLPSRLGFDAGAGLVDALADRSLDPEALVVDTDMPGLSVLPAGRKERNVPELLASARTGEVLQRLLLADPQRIILIDSPAALAASQASVLAGHAGQTLIVVRADRTSESDLRETVDLLSGSPHVALVLNQTALSLGGRRFGRYEERS